MKARWTVLALLALAAGASALWAGSGGGGDFPHERHARLFPRCTGCHAAAGGFAADGPLFPGKEACAACHDGRELGVVAWTGPRAAPSNLRFSHAKHASGLQARGQTADCATCHTADGATTVRELMRQVSGPRAEFCTRCHAHAAPAHLAEGARCRTCHVPLARAAGLDSAALAGLPRAPGHEAPGFALTHGAGIGAEQAQARCAVCHTRESCDRCHLNGAAMPAIAALDRDPRMARLLAGRAPVYPRPASHGASWGEQHAGAARTAVAQCANCHVREGCRTCHVGEGAQAQIAQLPGGSKAVGGSAPAATKAAPTGGAAVGTRAPAKAPRVRVHARGFADTHGAAAASGSSGCKGCHADSYCAKCHAGASRPVFHPLNYMARHGADAYGGAKDCGSCHNTESFCKTCHQGAGLAARGRIDVAFHDGQPLWLLQHGEAARKGLEGCVSCHRQQDCTRCHSAAGGWGVNPHGSGFDSGRMSERNQLVCGRCHATLPGSKP